MATHPYSGHVILPVPPGGLSSIILTRWIFCQVLLELGCRIPDIGGRPSSNFMSHVRRPEKRYDVFVGSNALFAGLHWCCREVLLGRSAQEPVLIPVDMTSAASHKREFSQTSTQCTVALHAKAYLSFAASPARAFMPKNANKGTLSLSSSQRPRMLPANRQASDVANV